VLSIATKYPCSGSVGSTTLMVSNGSIRIHLDITELISSAIEIQKEKSSKKIREE
jgi:hypothetical protein